MPSPQRARFYTGVLLYLWQQPKVPTPQALAEWINQQPWDDPPPDLKLLLGRLRLWPADKPYPPLPDDDALKLGTPDRPDSRWWVPGSEVGVPPPEIRRIIHRLT